VYKEGRFKKIQVEDFLKLIIVDIGTSINKTVVETQTAQRRHKNTKLPSLDDIKKLYEYLRKKRIEAFEALKQALNLSFIIIRLSWRKWHSEDFKNYEKINENLHKDIYTSLNQKQTKRSLKNIFESV